MPEQAAAPRRGDFVFDAELVSDAQPAWLDPAFWRARQALRLLGGGRGGIAVVATPAGEAVLKHYRRGGLVARLFGDRYLWTGARHARSLAEFALLRRLASEGLPVPVPLAAGVRRSGCCYRADLLTRRIAEASTLAERLARGTLDAATMRQVGALLARFHRAGVWHADLNAHNLLHAPDGWYLIDFDRGRLRAPASRWREANLRRLRRSLLKLGAAAQGEVAFESALWQPLLVAYRETFDA